MESLRKWVERLIDNEINLDEAIQLAAHLELWDLATLIFSKYRNYLIKRDTPFNQKIKRALDLFLVKALKSGPSAIRDSVREFTTKIIDEFPPEQYLSLIITLCQETERIPFVGNICYRLLLGKQDIPAEKRNVLIKYLFNYPETVPYDLSFLVPQQFDELKSLLGQIWSPSLLMSVIKDRLKNRPDTKTLLLFCDALRDRVAMSVNRASSEYEAMVSLWILCLQTLLLRLINERNLSFVSSVVWNLRELGFYRLSKWDNILFFEELCHAFLERGLREGVITDNHWYQLSPFFSKVLSDTYFIHITFIALCCGISSNAIVFTASDARRNAKQEELNQFMQKLCSFLVEHSQALSASYRPTLVGIILNLPFTGKYDFLQDLLNRRGFQKHLFNYLKAKRDGYLV